MTKSEILQVKLVAHIITTLKWRTALRFESLFLFDRKLKLKIFCRSPHGERGIEILTY